LPPAGNSMAPRYPLWTMAQALASEFALPQHLWRALQRFDVWIEPAPVAGWSRLMKIYGETQGRRLGDSVIIEAMAWSEPGRDVRVAREQALRLDPLP
jgi:hypothetical protein